MMHGTCSLCEGRVSTPDMWLGIVSPIPTCESCGAVAASHGPVILMRRIDSTNEYKTDGETHPLVKPFTTTNTVVITDNWVEVKDETKRS